MGLRHPLLERVVRRARLALGGAALDAALRLLLEQLLLLRPMGLHQRARQAAAAHQGRLPGAGRRGVVR
jgi:hypothetical protein